MSENLRKKLRAARPSLRSVSPVSFWFIALMGIFNLLIGVGFWAALRGVTEDPIFSLVSRVIPFEVWGVMFILLGIAKLAALKVNDWKWARWTLLTGVSLKSGWAVALTLRTVIHPDNMFLTVTWTTIAITQIIVYMYFLPPQEMRMFSGRVMDGDAKQ